MCRRNSAERHGDDEHEALHDGGTRDEHITVCAAVFSQHNVDGDEQHVIERDDERRRQTDLHNTAYPAEIDRLTGNTDGGSVTHQKTQDVRRRARLRQHGRKSSPCTPACAKMNTGSAIFTAAPSITDRIAVPENP